MDLTTGVWTDLEAANTLYNLYPYWKTCKNVLYVFDKTDGFWTDDLNVIKRIIGHFEQDLYLLQKKNGTIERSSKSYGNTTRMQNDMLVQLKTINVDNNWAKQTNNSSLGKLLFNNGYLDLKEQIFHEKGPYGFTHHHIVFFAKIEQDFGHLCEQDIVYMNDVQQRLFYNSLGNEVGEYLILMLARGLAGDKMKKILFGLGGTGCGKTVLSQAISQSCGDYVGCFNAENLSKSKYGNDEAQLMRWVMLLQHKRIIISNELDSTLELRSNMIKKMASCGDKLTGRTHCKEEEHFFTHFLPICFANDLPKIKTQDDAVDERLRIISYKKSYVRQPSNQFELLKDSNILEEIETPRFQKVFLALLIRKYFSLNHNVEQPEPQDVLLATKERVGDNCIVSFLRDFEITNDDVDYVESSKIQNWLQEHNFGTIEKLANDLKKYCKIQNILDVKRDYKKIRGISIR